MTWSQSLTVDIAEMMARQAGIFVTYDPAELLGFTVVDAERKKQYVPRLSGKTGGAPKTFKKSVDTVVSGFLRSVQNGGPKYGSLTLTDLKMLMAQRGVSDPYDLLNPTQKDHYMARADLIVVMHLVKRWTKQRVAKLLAITTSDVEVTLALRSYP